MNERSVDYDHKKRFEPDPTLGVEVEDFLEKTEYLDQSEPVINQEIAKTQPDHLVTEPVKPDFSKPPKLEDADMRNVDGDTVDFGLAQDYHQLIEMITREGVIKNQLGEAMPAEQVINLIYKLTYQDLNNFKKEDWTRITLRHRLRETVAKLIYEYKKSEEFKALVGLDLSGARDIETVINLIAQKKRLIDVQGNMVGADLIIDHIKNGHLHLLPEPIRYKIIELNNIISQEHISQHSLKSTTSIFKRAGRLFSKFKFWGK